MFAQFQSGPVRRLVARIARFIPGRRTGPMGTGVYVITFSDGGTLVGSSHNVDRRLDQHARHPRFADLNVRRIDFYDDE